MRKIQTQLYKDAFDKVKRMERVLRAVTEDGVPLTTACARENLQYKWFQRFVSQDIDADRDDQKTAVTVTWDDWSTWAGATPARYNGRDYPDTGGLR